jgi:hypothetical protein
MDDFIHKKFNSPDWGYLSDLSVMYPSLEKHRLYSDPYFFLKTERLVSDKTSFRSFRHCKPIKAGYYDHTIGECFSTLEQWAINAGGSLDLVVWGVNRETRFTVPLSTFLEKLGYGSSGKKPTFDDEVDGFLARMHITANDLIRHLVLRLD